MADLGVGELGIAVLGTAALGIAVVGIVVLGVAVLHSRNGSSNPALGSASLSLTKEASQSMHAQIHLASSSRWSSEDG